MAVESHSTYKEYFKALTEKNKALQYFHYGDSERVIGSQRSEISYPCLWLESPDINLKDNKSDNIQGDFHGAFNIISHCHSDDTEAQDTTMENNYQIALQVISRMVRDRRGRSDTPMFNLDLNTVQMNPINAMMIDNNYGWRIEFRLNNNVNICYDETKWEA